MGTTFVALPGSNLDDIPIPEGFCSKPCAGPQSGYNLLIPFLQQQNRRIYRVLGDGNCLFRALSFQLTGTQDHHLELRKLITNFEKNNEEVFSGLHNAINCNTSFSEHIKNMKKTCTWGTTVEILACSSLFQADVFFATDSYCLGQATWIKYSPRTAPSSDLSRSTFISHLKMKNEWIEIIHVSQTHFDAIEPVTVTTKLSSPPIIEASMTEQINIE